MSLNHGLEHESYKRDRKASRIIGGLGVLLLIVGAAGYFGQEVGPDALARAALLIIPAALLVAAFDWFSK